MVPELDARPALLALFAAVSCGGSEEVPRAIEAAPAGAAAPPVSSPTQRSRPELPPLLQVDLSEEAVADMTLGELWTIGVEFLGWPRELPAEATKEGVHQRLLAIKYRDVGDFGELGYAGDRGYAED